MALPIVAGREKPGVKIGNGEAARCGDTGAPDAGLYDEYDTSEDRASAGDGELAGEDSIHDTTGSTAADSFDRFWREARGFSESLESLNFDSDFPPLLAIGALWGAALRFSNGALPTATA